MEETGSTDHKMEGTEILCHMSGKIIWKQGYGPSGKISRYKTEFKENEVIGVGGYGCVVDCTNKLDGKRYAVKKIRLEDIDMDFEHVVREVKAMAEMDHPNIVRYFSAWIEREIVGGFSEAGAEKGMFEEPESTDGPFLYIQQELCSSSLNDLLTDAPMREAQVWEIFKQIVQGLDHIHKKNVRHGDLSTNNIFFDEEKKVKIGDFGLASLTAEGFLGPDSPRAFGLYCAPELNEGNFYLASDVYSLGVILLEMFGGYSTQMEKTEALKYFNDNKKLLNSPLPDDQSSEEEKLNLIAELTAADPRERPLVNKILQAQPWKSHLIDSNPEMEL